MNTSATSYFPETPLTTVRLEAANRFQEAQSFLSAIKSLEEARRQHADEINVRKGLFLVLLYGPFEYSLTRTLTESTILINAFQVQYGHINEMLYALALDPQISSLTAPGAGRDSKWQRRAELFRKQLCGDPVVLFDGAFAPELQNSWQTRSKECSMFLELASRHYTILEPSNTQTKLWIREMLLPTGEKAHQL